MTNWWLKKLNDEFLLVQNYFKGLQLNPKGKITSIDGALGFCCDSKNGEICDAYLLHIVIDRNYPKTMPTVFETGGRIPKNFHRMTNDLSLCLGTNLETQIAYDEDQSIMGFIHNLLIPYLFSYSYHERFGEMPFGERSHGNAGVLESNDYLLNQYCDLIGGKNKKECVKLFSIAEDGGYMGHKPCPCGSGKILRICHGHVLLPIFKKHEISTIIQLYHGMLDAYQRSIKKSRAIKDE